MGEKTDVVVCVRVCFFLMLKNYFFNLFSCVTKHFMHTSNFGIKPIKTVDEIQWSQCYIFFDMKYHLFFLMVSLDKNTFFFYYSGWTERIIFGKSIAYVFIINSKFLLNISNDPVFWWIIKGSLCLIPFVVPKGFCFSHFPPQSSDMKPISTIENE